MSAAPEQSNSGVPEEAEARAESAVRWAAPTCDRCGVEYIAEYRGPCQEERCRGTVAFHPKEVARQALAAALPAIHAQRDQEWQEKLERVRQMLSERNLRATELATNDELRDGQVKSATDPRLEGEIAALEAALAALASPPHKDPEVPRCGGKRHIVTIREFGGNVMPCPGCADCQPTPGPPGEEDDFCKRCNGSFGEVGCEHCNPAAYAGLYKRERDAERARLVELLRECEDHRGGEDPDDAGATDGRLYQLVHTILREVPRVVAEQLSTQPVPGHSGRVEEGLPPELIEALRDPTIIIDRDREITLPNGQTLAEHLEEWRNAPTNTASAAASTQPSSPPPIPRDYWREVPCGHPPDPVAMYNCEGRPVCHCGCLLDTAGLLPAPPDAPGPLSHCQQCGCHVAIPPAPSSPPPSPQGDPVELFAERLYHHNRAGRGLPDDPWPDAPEDTKEAWREDARSYLAFVTPLLPGSSYALELRERLGAVVEAAVDAYLANEKALPEALDAGCDLSQLPSSLAVAKTAALAALDTPAPSAPREDGHLG